MPGLLYPRFAKSYTPPAHLHITRTQRCNSRAKNDTVSARSFTSSGKRFTIHAQKYTWTGKTYTPIEGKYA